MSDPEQAPTVPSRRRWDGYRRISAWAGLLEAAAVIAAVSAFGSRLTGDGPDPGTTWAIVLLLGAPAVLAGLVSGSRYFGLYAGYARRLDPTAALSDADSARGASAASSVIGDALWGTLIAGCAGAIPATVAFTQLVGVAAVIMLPLFALVIGIAWFTGWAAGAVASLVLSTALGIVVGVRGRARRLPWLVVAVLLPALLVAVAVPVAGVRFADERLDAWGAIVVVAGAPAADSGFTLGEPALWIARIAIWLTVVLLGVLVVVGTPALLRRRGEISGSRPSRSDRRPSDR